MIRRGATVAIEQLRRECGLGVSQAVNELVRGGALAGLLPRPAGRRFRQRTAPLGLRVDVSNVGDALDTLEGPTSR